jgi:hypothetical protein
MSEPEPESADHLQQTVIELFERIMAELAGRLENPLSESDRMAVVTAVQKAAMEGARAGVVDMTARVSEAEDELHIDLNMETFQPVDTWALEYGDGT